MNDNNHRIKGVYSFFVLFFLILCGLWVFISIGCTIVYVSKVNGGANINVDKQGTLKTNIEKEPINGKKINLKKLNQ